MHKYSQIACLQYDATPRRAAAQRNTVSAHFATRPLGRSPTVQEFSILRYFRKLLPSSSRTDGIRGVEHRDPLDVCLFSLFPPLLT